MASSTSILFQNVTDIKIGSNEIYKIVRKGYYPTMTKVYGVSFDLDATRQFVKDNARPGRRLKIVGDLVDGYYVYQSDWISNDNTVLWQRIVDMGISVSYTAGNSYFDLVFTKPAATECTIQYHTGDSKWKDYTETVSATGCRFSATSTTSFYIAISHQRYNTKYINYMLTYTDGSSWTEVITTTSDASTAYQVAKWYGGYVQAISGWWSWSGPASGGTTYVVKVDHKTSGSWSGTCI